MKNKPTADKEVRMLHGDKFMDELTDKFNLRMEKEMTEVKSANNDVNVRIETPTTIKHKLTKVFESNIMYWIAGFLDGLVVAYLIKEIMK